jgi:hypothetical protein
MGSRGHARSSQRAQPGHDGGQAARSPEEVDFSGNTFEEVLAWRPAWLVAPELGVGPFTV